MNVGTQQMQKHNKLRNILFTTRQDEERVTLATEEMTQTRTTTRYAKKKNVFVKPNEQNRACSGYAMARKRRMESNYSIVPWGTSAMS